MERGVSTVRALIVLVILGALTYAGVYSYGWLKLTGAESSFSKRLAEAGGGTPGGNKIDQEVIRQRLIKIAAEEGLTLAPEDVKVVIEPIDERNIEKLAVYERAAIGIAGKLKNHKVDALLLGISVRVSHAWGPVKRQEVLERTTWIRKTLVKPGEAR